MNGGARRDRTADLLRATQALSQLSYSPKKIRIIYHQYLQSELFDILNKWNLCCQPTLLT